MTATTPTTAPRRRPSATWLFVLAVVVLIVALIAAGLALRTDVDVVPAQEGRTAVEPLPAARQAHAAQMAAAAAELKALDATIRDVPAIADAMHDRLVLLRLVTAGDVPVQALRAAIPPVPATRQVHAERMAAAGAELQALDAAARAEPSIADAMHDRLVLLRLVTAGDVPVETLGAVER